VHEQTHGFFVEKSLQQTAEDHLRAFRQSSASFLLLQGKQPLKENGNLGNVVKVIAERVLGNVVVGAKFPKSTDRLGNFGFAICNTRRHTPFSIRLVSFGGGSCVATFLGHFLFGDGLVGLFGWLIGKKKKKKTRRKREKRKKRKRWRIYTFFSVRTEKKNSKFKLSCQCERNKLEVKFTPLKVLIFANLDGFPFFYFFSPKPNTNVIRQPNSFH
jgi:hypothetical protein